MRRVLIFCALALMCAVPALGVEITVPGLDQVWEEAEGYGVSQKDSLDQGLSNLFSDVLGQAGALFRVSLATAMKLIAVVLLCSLAESVKAGEGLQAANIAGALAITALTMTDMAVMIGLGRDTLGRMEDFSTLLLPVMAVLTAATGHVSAAAVRQGATVLFSQLLITAMDRLLIPLVYAFVAVSCAHAAVGNPGLKKVADLLKSAITFVLTALLLAFVGYLTASGAIAGSVDAAAVKAAKLAISRAVPVVGGILADASESVLAGAGALRGTVGAVGLMVVLAICLPPFLRLALQYVVYKGAAALCATVAQPQLAGLIDAIGSAFGLVLGMTGAGALVLLVSLVSAIGAVTP
ncbi:MAG: stage III sporulation protein AE [Lawsonibacter sp.]|jgi:stage III sporulation protein AE|nr:stage III sporulation protein AE [Lawsonibacter sp.]